MEIACAAVAVLRCFFFFLFPQLATSLIFCVDDAKLSALSPRVLVAAGSCCCLPCDVSFDEKPSLVLIKELQRR